MKVYNKKGLAWGIFWTVLGLFSLYRDFVDPDSFWLQQGKSVVISAVMVLIGVTGFVRAFPKRPPGRTGLRSWTSATGW